MNDEKLMLYYYDDGLDAAERAAIQARLAADEVLRARFDKLRSELDALSQDDVPAPEALTHRLHDLVEQAARREQRSTRRSRFDMTAFFMGAAVTAALVVGIGLGSLLDRPATPVGTEFVSIPPTSPDTLARGLRVHFTETRSQLLDSDADRILVAGRIIEQNRVLGQLADDSGAHDLARILRAMEPVLVRLATEDLTPAEAAAMQQQLVFEMNVVLTKLTRQASDSTST